MIIAVAECSKSISSCHSSGSREPCTCHQPGSAARRTSSGSSSRSGLPTWQKPGSAATENGDQIVLAPQQVEPLAERLDCINNYLTYGEE